MIKHPCISVTFVFIALLIQPAFAQEEEVQSGHKKSDWYIQPYSFITYVKSEVNGDDIPGYDEGVKHPLNWGLLLGRINYFAGNRIALDWGLGYEYRRDKMSREATFDNPVSNTDRYTHFLIGTADAHLFFNPESNIKYGVSLGTTPSVMLATVTHVKIFGDDVTLDKFDISDKFYFNLSFQFGGDVFIPLSDKMTLTLRPFVRHRFFYTPKNKVDLLGNGTAIVTIDTYENTVGLKAGVTF